MRNISLLVWHCSATPEGRPVSVETIRQWHKARGWSDIGYHYVVHLDGKVEEGRPISKIGAHVKGHNTGSVGCVYVGGVDNTSKLNPKDTRTEAQKKAMIKLTEELVKKYDITRIAGHNEFSSKACPSFNVPKDALGNISGFKNGKRV